MTTTTRTNLLYAVRTDK